LVAGFFLIIIPSLFYIKKFGVFFFPKKFAKFDLEKKTDKNCQKRKHWLLVVEDTKVGVVCVCITTLHFTEHKGKTIMTEKTNWLMRVMGRVGGGKVQAKK
jgi:hypothetical protein